MMSESVMLRSATAILVGFLLIPGVSWGATFNPRNYFVNTTKGLGQATSCTAQVRTNAGTFNRTFAYSAGHCPSVQLFMWTKGAPPWSEEHFYAGGGYIWLLDDTGDDPSNPARLDQSHVLYEAPGVHGLKVFVDGNVSNYKRIDHPGYYVQKWTGNTCPSTFNWVQGPFVGYEENAWVGTVSGWLYDCRAGRPCTNGTAYSVEVIRRSGGGSGGVDHFWFARWQDPMDGNQWRGLGPIKFWCTGDNGSGWCAPASEYHYLVDCTVTPTCYACP